MNELQIFNNSEFGEYRNEAKLGEILSGGKNELKKLRCLDKELKGQYLGVVYGVEFGDFLKIGHTCHPYSRIMQLKSVAEKYGNSQLGNWCVSVAHTNHGENENKIFRYFSPSRKAGTELFDITLNDFSALLQSGYLEFLGTRDENKKRDQAFLEYMKALLFPEMIPPVLNLFKERIKHISNSIAKIEEEICIFELECDSLSAERDLRDGKPTYLPKGIKFLPVIEKDADYNLAPENREW